jgi:hypothetical protein
MTPNLNIIKCDQHKIYTFRCDDRAGFLLRVVKSGDGDLHISIDVDNDHEDREMHRKWVSGSVRLRMPMIGGGMWEHLYNAISDAIKKYDIVYAHDTIITQAKSAYSHGAGYSNVIGYLKNCVGMSHSDAQRFYHDHKKEICL